jgi:hypothetical protein
MEPEPLHLLLPSQLSKGAHQPRPGPKDGLEVRVENLELNSALTLGCWSGQWVGCELKQQVWIYLSQES